MHSVLLEFAIYLICINCASLLHGHGHQISDVSKHELCGLYCSVFREINHLSLKPYFIPTDQFFLGELQKYAKIKYLF